MDSDAFLRSNMRKLVEDVQVPEVSLDEIHRKMRVTTITRTFPIGRFAAIAAAIALMLAPLTSRSLVTSLETRIAQLLHWSPPPPPPHSLTAGISVQTVTLDEAQAKVPFKIVQPSGVPADVTTSKILLVPTLSYSTSHTWRRSTNQIEFTFTRSDGRTFMLIASAYDPKAAAPSKYMFNADEVDAKGLPRRYDRIAWRNGDQMSEIIADGISVSEAQAIREAMHGTPIAPGKGSTGVQYMKIGKP